jgi:Glycosyltransferase Family 4
LSLRVLFTNITLAGRTGTEIVTRDLALGLHGRGHHVAVYTPAWGPLADELEAGGVNVATRLDQVGQPDIVHGHHFVETAEALLRFPTARGVFVCHDRTASHSIPPRLGSILRYVAVDENCLERLRQDWEIPASHSRVITNAVDMTRFQARAPLSERPARALVFSHYASPATHVDIVRAACDRLGIPLDVIGAGAGNVVADPEAQLPQYDLVFAKGRCALEAMAVGAAVVLCDAGGSGPMITADLVPRLRQWNFGARTLSDPLDVDRLAQEIQKYDPAGAAAVSAMIRQDAALDVALDRYEELYREVMGLAVEDRGIRPLVAALLRRTGRLEQEVSACRGLDRMPALSDDEISRIQIDIERAPQTMAAGAVTFVRVRIRNQTDMPLGAWQPFPLQLACRWKPVGSAHFDTAEGSPRTALHKGVAAGSGESFYMRVAAPALAGRYILRVTLVQEWKRWLDELPTPACAETTVVVNKQTLLTDLGARTS